LRFKASPRQIVCETLSQKCPTQKSTGGVAQDIGPEFKAQHYQKKKTERYLFVSKLVY
jgi:hypothetical protein